MTTQQPPSMSMHPVTGIVSKRCFAISALLLLLFGLLTIFTAGDGVLTIDVKISRWVQSIPITGMTSIAEFGSFIGSFPVLAPFTLLCIIALFWRRQPGSAALLAFAGILHSTNSLLKWLIDSPRPTTNYVAVLAAASGNGFPSGHATGSVLIFGACAIITTRFLSSMLWKSITVGFWLLLIMIVGFARIKEGVHWPSDVLGGFLWGAAMLCFANIAVHALSLNLSRLNSSPNETE